MDLTEVIDQVYLADPELISQLDWITGQLDQLISISSHTYAALLFVIGVATSILVLVLLYKAWKILF